MVIKRYQDVFPIEPLLRSSDRSRAAAAGLLNLDYFEAEPASMRPQVYDQHHILLSLDPQPHRVENWRDGEHRDFIFRQYEVIVTPAGVSSGWRWHTKGKTLLITLELARLERFAKQELGIVLTKEQLKGVSQFLDKDIATAGEMMLEALRNKSTGSDIMYESYARVFLVKLIQKYGVERKEELVFTRSFTALHYKKVLLYIDNNFDKRIVVEDMAAEAGLSPYHFSRLFKKTIGQSPHQFLLAFRIEQAKKIMRSNKKAKLFDIAVSSGFSDQAHFNRVFKQLSGKTPGCWRKEIDNIESKIS